MADPEPSPRFLFPRWANLIVPAALIAIAGGMPYVLILVGFGAAPSTTDVGYQPNQPVPYSHELHVNQLGMDCRYCHTTVEKAAFAAIPPTETCMNCHHAVRAGSEQLEALYESFRTGLPVTWTKVHDLPDYAYFNHSAHINKGVSCVSCHGRVDRMGAEGVHQVATLSMGWCLDCHRDPTPNLRPPDEVFNMLWGTDLTEEQRLAKAQEVHQQVKIKSPSQLTDCSTCHR